MAALLVVAIAAGGVVQEKPKEASPPELPRAVDLRPALAKLGVRPRRQGARPTCSVFATAGALEAAIARVDPKAVPVSVEFLNWATSEARGQRGDGGFFHQILKGFAEHGICRDELMPYARGFDPARRPSEEALADAAARAKATAGRIRVHWVRRWAKEGGLDAGQLAETKSVLARGWPVAAGSHHSRLFVGYRDDPEKKCGGVFLTQDSATGKHGEVTYEFARTLVFDAFWVETLAAAPQPRGESRPAGRASNGGSGGAELVRIPHRSPAATPHLLVHAAPGRLRCPRSRSSAWNGIYGVSRRALVSNPD